MVRRIWVILFFIVVFSLPVAWYLFLQLFGENKFVLPIISKYEVKNCEVQGPVILSKLLLVEENPNEFERLLKQLDNTSDVGFYSIDSACTIGYDLIFLDHSEMIRGQYGSTREEIDRLLAEVDIYLLNLDREKSNKSQ